MDADARCERPGGWLIAECGPGQWAPHQWLQTKREGVQNWPNFAGVF